MRPLGPGRSIRKIDNVLQADGDGVYCFSEGPGKSVGASRERGRDEGLRALKTGNGLEETRCNNASH